MARVVILSEQELFPRHSWSITSLARDPLRGEVENTFGERKSTLWAQLPSPPRPKRQHAGKTIERSDPPAETEWRPHNEALLLLALLAVRSRPDGGRGQRLLAVHLQPAGHGYAG